LKLSHSNVFEHCFAPILHIYIANKKSNNHHWFELLTVVGISNVVVVSIAGNDSNKSSLTSLPLAAFFAGSALVSIFKILSSIAETTKKKVKRTGGNISSASSLPPPPPPPRKKSLSRKIAWTGWSPCTVQFLAGAGWGFAGTALSMASVELEALPLNVLAALCFGAANGIGFGLRFAAVELVPAAFAARAVTLVVAGGVLAAAVGPESAYRARDLFGAKNGGKNDSGSDRRSPYLGVYMITGIFNLLNVLFLLAIRFPTDPTIARTAAPTNDDPPPPSSSSASLVIPTATNSAYEDDRIRDDGHRGGVSSSSNSINSIASGGVQRPPPPTATRAAYLSLLQSRAFVVPALVAALSWAIMAVPMGIVRVAALDAGYTARQSLTVIELHFLAMFGTGFVSGQRIQWYGVRTLCWTGAAVFAVSLLLNVFSYSAERGTIATWYLGLVGLGVGWNLAFTAATVWLSEAVAVGGGAAVVAKSQIQSANDCFMFLFAGAWIFSSSYIYNGGGGGIQGWRTLNFVVVGLVGTYVAVLAVDEVLRRRNSTNCKNDVTADAQAQSNNLGKERRSEWKVSAQPEEATNDSIEVVEMRFVA
jgi:hypothetical protein